MSLFISFLLCQYHTQYIFPVHPYLILTLTSHLHSQPLITTSKLQSALLSCTEHKKRKQQE